MSCNDHNFPLPTAGLYKAREKYAACQAEKVALEEMINTGTRGYVTGSVGSFSGRRKRVASGRRGSFIVTNGRGTKICLIKTWRGQHSRALGRCMAWKGINSPPRVVGTTEFNPYPPRATWDQRVFISTKRGRENEREITRLDLFVCSFPLYRLKYHSPSLSLSFFISFSLCRLFREKWIYLFQFGIFGFWIF